jgi:hypothetical protein
MINYWKLALRLLIMFFLIMLFAERFERWQSVPGYAWPHFPDAFRGLLPDIAFSFIMSLGLTPLTLLGIFVCGKFKKNDETTTGL